MNDSLPVKTIAIEDIADCVVNDVYKSVVDYCKIKRSKAVRSRRAAFRNKDTLKETYYDGIVAAYTEMLKALDTAQKE